MIQFSSANPAIATFNAARDRSRQDDRDARERITFENQQAADAALRRGIGTYYAEQPPVNEPAPPGVSAAAQPVAQPAPAGPPPAAAFGPTTLGPRRPYDFAEGGEVAATSAALAASPPPPPQAPAAAPAPVAQPTAVRAAPSVRPGFGPIQRELANAPGTGGQMLSLFSADQTSQRAAAVEQRKLEAEGHKLWVQSLKDGDVGMAKEIGKRYGLNIPEQVYTDRGMMIDARVAANLSKTMGVKEEQALEFVSEFLKARHGGADQQQAAQTAAAAARNMHGTFRVKGHITNDAGETTFYNERGNTQPGPQGRTTRKPGGGTGAGGDPGGKQAAYAKWRIDTLVASGVPLAQAQQMVAGGTANRPLTAAQRLTAANKLLSATDKVGRKIYPNLDAALKAIDAASSGAAAPAAAPGPAAPAAPAAAPAATPAQPKTRLRFNPGTGQLEPIANAQ